MSTPLLIDADNLIKTHILASALDDLKAGEIFTGGVYGTLISLAAFLKQPEAQEIGGIYAFFDAGVPAARKKALPDYKAERKVKQAQFTDAQRDKMFSQMALAREALETLGVQCLAFKDREADDGIAAAVRSMPGRSPIVYSTDRDLLQTVSMGARVYRPSAKEWVTEENFREKTGVPEKCYLLYRTLVGDPSDSIKGALGCGEVKAKKLIYDCIEAGLLLDCPADEQLLDVTSFVNQIEHKLKWHTDLLADYDRLQATLVAINLWTSFGGTQGLKATLASPPPAVSQQQFLRLCSRLQFASLMGSPERVLGPFRRARQRWTAAVKVPA